MKNRRKILETQQLDEVGGEPLEGSGFEGELPESTIGPDDDERPDNRSKEDKKERRDVQ